MNQTEIRRKQVQAIVYLFSLITIMIIARLTGYHGVTYVACAVEIYFFVSILVSGGVIDALSRILRSRNSKGQYRNAESMRRNAFLVQILFGILGTLAIWAMASSVPEKLFHIRYSVLILSLLAPAVLLNTLSSLFIGYVRGEGVDLAGAIAGVLRQLLIIGLSFLFCGLFRNYGIKVSHLLGQENFIYMYAGVGFAIAVLLSEVIITLLLVLLFIFIKKHKKNERQEGLKKKDTIFYSIRILCINRLAGAVVMMAMLLPFPTGLLLLQKTAVDLEEIATCYGMYLAVYVVICALPAILVSIAVLPVCGKTMSLIRKEENRYAKTVFQSGVHAGIVYGVYATVLLTVLSKPMAELLCGTTEDVDIAVKMIAGGASVILFSVLMIYFIRILVLTGKKGFVIAVVYLADLFFALMTYLFLNSGNAGILALVYAGILTTGIVCMIFGTMAYHQMRQRMDWLQVVILPVGVSCIAGLLTMLVGKLLLPHLGNLFAVFLCLLISMTVYFAGLLLLRNFSEQELENFPGGRWISLVGQTLKVF